MHLFLAIRNLPDIPMHPHRIFPKWRFKICLPSLYTLIEFPPNYQNTLKLFVSIKCTNIYISSNKFVLNRSVPIEVQLIIFPLSC
jgi:hypothetical protein